MYYSLSFCIEKIMREIYLQRLGVLLERINRLKLDEPSLLAQISIFQNQLASPEFHNEGLEQRLQEIEQLTNNLCIAKEACDYVNRRMRAANKPLSPAGMRILEDFRTKMNDTQLRQVFNRFKERREQIEYPEFEQTAFRKGTGYNMSMWYYHAHSRSPVFGNCSEQANCAFVFLYSLAREAASSHVASPVHSLYRIDIKNERGGHTLLLMNLEHTGLFPKTAEELIPYCASLPATVIVIDPWNKKRPYYPAIEMKRYMPSCGKTGLVNIEFGLKFSALEEAEIKPRL
ncbi:hypothetical protein B1207_07990 [Legionella quinlivanii]|uniref:Uncharacterized protein n=2 Tax=Legionella quinlivanii TaxID=45073 RepID=A0A364LJP4_9GAMM|nr:hypothetical protein B1207_07990 [Legionella quinlivanii]